ncbi:MAG: hypothetical protein KDA99_23205, partial [Planctomycetales bacterium]|nr:hypothetical protein [Planctomycetales bacterium]
CNFPQDGVVQFRLGEGAGPGQVRDSWARFPLGIDYVLRREGYSLKTGFDAVLFGNIPGGGMSRSASLALNLIITAFEVNNVEGVEPFRIVDLAQLVENDYIGSPCGKLDQIMIMFARDGMGTHYNPQQRTIDYVPLGADAGDFRIVSLDTGTVRPGLEKSTYKLRREECERLAAMAAEPFGIENLAAVREAKLYAKLVATYAQEFPELCRRLKYIYESQQRFYQMLDAWKKGDIQQVGRIFRADGIGLRDDYQISGPELETMCDIVRSVPGVLGERMLGGGDKGASGAIVRAGAVDAVKAAVDQGYPLSRPDFADRYAVHVCKVVDGIVRLDGLGRKP